MEIVMPLDDHQKDGVSTIQADSTFGGRWSDKDSNK
jgi:hypothetical protein